MKTQQRRFASKRQRDTLYLVQDGQCAICGTDLEHGFHVDHIQPFSQKGETSLWNLQAICCQCHFKKHSAADKAKSSPLH